MFGRRGYGKSTYGGGIAVAGTGIGECDVEAAPGICRKIGQEFFYITARKFAKNSTVECYSKFFFTMSQVFDYDGQFVQKFMNKERELSEIQELLDFMRTWSSVELKEELRHILVNSLIIALDRLLLLGKFEDYFQLYESQKEFFNRDD